MSASKFAIAWWTLEKTTRPRAHASLRLASEQVSSRFREGLGPASTMDFGTLNPQQIDLMEFAGSLGYASSSLAAIPPCSLFITADPITSQIISRRHHIIQYTLPQPDQTAVNCRAM